MGSAFRKEAVSIELNPDAPVITVKGILTPIDRGDVVDFPFYETVADGSTQHVGTVRYTKANYLKMMRQLYALQRSIAYGEAENWPDVHGGHSAIC